MWPSGVQTVSRKYKKLTPHNSCGDYFLVERSEKNSKLYTKLEIANCNFCHVFSGTAPPSVFYQSCDCHGTPDPVRTLGCSGAAACQKGVGLEEVTQFHKPKPSLTPSPSSIHTCIYVSPPPPFTHHTPAVLVCVMIPNRVWPHETKVS